MLNFKKITAAAVCCVLFTAFASGCGDDTSGSSEKGSGSEASSASSTQTEAGKVLNFTAPEKGEEIAVLTIKDYGDIKIKLFPEEAEKGVENNKFSVEVEKLFVTYDEKGNFAGLSVDRKSVV